MADDDSLLKTLDSIVPAPVAKFDAFPKLPSTYRSRSKERGFLTIFVAIVALLLVLNDIGEFIWGRQDFEFDVDHDRHSLMDITVDMVVNMPCRCELLRRTLYHSHIIRKCRRSFR
jgi:endoplasmic reticulum-Golgi intermediate compartment protein 2